MPLRVAYFVQTIPAHDGEGCTQGIPGPVTQPPFHVLSVEEKDGNR
jgi:hypothetical protein